MLSLLATVVLTVQANESNAPATGDSQTEAIVMESDEATEGTVLQCDENNENYEEVVIDECVNISDLPECTAEVDLIGEVSSDDESSETGEEETSSENTETMQ